jgi:hypothetical protein
MTRVVAVAYVASVALLFASRVREFADETDNLLGGLLIARGQKLYVDFFSSHMPLPYYVAAAPAAFGVSSLEQFRVYSNVLLVLATLAFVWAFRHRLPLLVLGAWATLTVFAHTLQWGEMLTASTCAGYGVLLVGWLFFTIPDLRFTRADTLALSLGVFIALQSELIAIYPLALLGVCFVAVRLRAAGRTSLQREVRAIAATAGVVALPHVLLLLGLGLFGMLGDFVYFAYLFNQSYYSQFVMNPSVVGMLHDWEAQYRTYLQLSLQQPLSVHGALVIANFIGAWIVFRTRGILSAAVYYLFVALCHVRDEGAYYLASYFSLALAIAWAVGTLGQARERWELLVKAGAVAATTVFVVQVARTYDLSARPPRDAPEVAAIQALTAPDERIFVAPFDQYVYLAADRMPASRYSYYLPWHAADPRIRAELLEDLRRARPPLVVFRRDELVIDQWLPSQYAADVYAFLESQGYAVLDSRVPSVDNILVRQDRLTSARERLRALQLSAPGG